MEWNDSTWGWKLTLEPWSAFHTFYTTRPWLLCGAKDTKKQLIKADQIRKQMSRRWIVTMGRCHHLVSMTRAVVCMAKHGRGCWSCSTDLCLQSDPHHVERGDLKARKPIRQADSKQNSFCKNCHQWKWFKSEPEKKWQGHHPKQKSSFDVDCTQAHIKILKRPVRQRHSYHISHRIDACHEHPESEPQGVISRRSSCCWHSMIHGGTPIPTTHQRARQQLMMSLGTTRLSSE